MIVATYPTKKALRESIGKSLAFQETSMFGAEYCSTGEFLVVGPSADNRKWFGSVTMSANTIIKVL